MKWFVILFTLIFISISVVGFTALCEKPNHDVMSSGVMASAVDCFAQGVLMSVEHVSAYQSFSNVQPSLFLVLLLTVVVALFIYEYSLRYLKLQPLFCFESGDVPKDVGQRLLISRWLSLFEHSPCR